MPGLRRLLCTLFLPPAFLLAAPLSFRDGGPSGRKNHLLFNDVAVAKIADQQVVSEFAEARWSERQPPGRVEDAVCGETRLPRAVGCKHVDEAVPGTTDVIVLLVVLQSKGDVEIAFNVFNPERSVAQRDRGIGEGLCEVERRVVHLYDSIV